ncbi:MAG: hypothetical protein ACREN4_01060 [Candidatus Dormibacteria bacterium]
MRKLYHHGLAVAAGLGVAAVGGVSAAAAASPASTPTTSASPASGSAGATMHNRVDRFLRRHSAAGEVVSDSSSGGTLGQGVLVIKEPDGTEITLNLSSKTKAWKYQGHGTKPVSESPTSIAAGEVVVILGRNYQDHPVVGRILDLGFQAQG